MTAFDVVTTCASSVPHLRPHRPAGSRPISSTRSSDSARRIRRSISSGALDGTLGDRRIFTASGAAVGMGDLTARLKSTLLRRGSNGVALGLDLRIPTGDQENLLGAGAPGVKPFLIWCLVRLVLASCQRRTSGTARACWRGTRAPGNRTCPITAPWSSAPTSGSARVTFSLDFLGQLIIDAPRLRSREFLSLNGCLRFPISRSRKHLSTR